MNWKEKEAELRQHRANNMPIAQIAKRYETTPSKVKNALHRFGIVRGSKFTEGQRYALRNFNGHNGKKIDDHLGKRKPWAQPTFYRLVKRTGTKTGFSSEQIAQFQAGQHDGFTEQELSAIKWQLKRIKNDAGTEEAKTN